MAHKLHKEPAFVWWVSYTLRKRDRIIKKVQARMQKKNYKFGIEIPNTLKRALEIDRETNTDFWAKAIIKEMKNCLCIFEFLDDDAPLPVGYQRIPYRIVFDVKMDLTRKARICAGGHTTDPPSSITYASVVSRDSVRIALMYAALNDLPILAGDIGNAYLNAETKEKVYIICGPEFKQNEGKRALVRRAWYGLKSSGAAWRSHLANILRDELCFKSCYADNDVWMRKGEGHTGEEVYEYILVYTDDILIISIYGKEIMSQLDQHCMVKKDSIGFPDIYLGAQISTYQLADGTHHYALSADKYVQEALKNVRDHLESRNRQLKKKTPGILPTGYCPELDTSQYLNDEDANYYQQQIGVLRWAVEIGRIDITCAVSMMAAFNAAPRAGHLEAVFHIFAYLQSHARSKNVMDCHQWDIPVGIFCEEDWSEFYPDAIDEEPPNMPEPRGKYVQVVTFVDADNAGCLLTRRSRTGVLIYVNKAPVLWYSKRQNSVETSTFGSEFMALKTAVELSEGILYKLRMMGIGVEMPMHMRCDNKSVVYNTSNPASTLKKKSNSVAYHFVRERAAAEIIDVEHECTDTNLADILTKILIGEKRDTMTKMILY